MKDTAKTACKRCGTCCRKGGPALHLEDRQLVAKNLLPVASLFTIRPAEPVIDNVAGRITLAESDIIKIKSAADCPACMFLETESNTCSIYGHRPLECRVLECRQPERLQSIYRRERLSRRDILLPQKAWLWDLVCEHQRRCDYLEVARLARRWLASADEEVSTALMDIMRYDAGLREVCRREGGIAPELLDFLFGVSLSVTIARFGLNLVRSREGKYRFTARKQ